MLQRSFLAVLGGVLLTASFEPLALAWLLPLGVAGFALVTAGLSVRRAGVVGLVFGIAFYFSHIEWMRASVGPDAWVALSAVEAAFYGLMGVATPLLRRLPLWPVWMAATWTTMETVRSGWPFSGMPWGRLAFAAIDTPAAPAVAYVGMTGLSFLLALLGFLLAQAVEKRTLRDTGALVGLLAIMVVPAVWPITLAQSGTATVAVVQGDVPGPGNDILWDPRGVTENHVDATVKLAADVSAGKVAAPDFVLWPENSTAVDPFEDLPVNSGINEAVSAIGVPVVVGGIVDEGEKYVLNQGIVWDPVSGPGDRYTKHHPVPYGEYIPFRDLWDPKFGQLALITRDMKSGTRTEPLRVAGLRVSDAICFDVAYDDVMPPQVRDGAELLTVQTSNASFIFTHQIEQQFAITRLRAIEAGRWLTVASTNGRSGVIRPDGSVAATAGIRSTSVLVEKVGLSTELTPAMWLGAWPTRLFTGSTLGALVAGAIAYRRRREFAGPVEVPAKEPTDAC
ncbi:MULTISPECIES: apolipoprotein N-acyltransferase [unclassified Nocardioides]|uniref:apolipoprotein N-acyltransferase n=1 Tax=unclassified Nocardioides TaxID=2615069 RepID=UPI000703BFC2|nr:MULTISPECIES: apolipoprotein N-acyltransferase [unclassified Nocardioides]KRC50193.1 apolipoprotein acyltransferase [Nocardioides sp. Root79]KRC75660.1 apolipoprotein acyltransferase [Nocardioides sp. Root240]